MTTEPRSCLVCGSAVSRLRQVRFGASTFCGHGCAGTARDGAVKSRLDASDTSPTVCRCEGAPQPVEPAGFHCAGCRRMFSAGVRMWLIRRERRRRLVGFDGVVRWLEELAAQLRLQS